MDNIRGQGPISTGELLGSIKKPNTMTAKQRQDKLTKDIEEFLTKPRKDGSMGQIEKIEIGKGAMKTKFTSGIVKARL